MYKSVIHLLILILSLSACKDIYEDFPVPPASTVAAFSFEILDDETREVAFTNNSIVPESAGNVTYTWSFGDGTNSNETSPTHTYNNYGAFTVKLVLITTGSSEIKSDSTTLTLIQPIDIDFTLYYMDTDFSTIRAVGQTTLDIEVGVFGSGLAIDPVSEKIFFVDDDNFEIKTANLDGSNIETLFDGLSGATNIALDTAGRRVYWTNRADGTVLRGNMDGSGTAETIINSLSLPEGIAFHDGKVYVSDVDEPPVGENIYVANANGSGLEVFVPGAWGYGMGIDAVNERIYYGDQGVFDDPADNRIRSVSINDPSDIQLVAELEATGGNGSRTYGIAIDHVEQKVIWSDRASRQIKRANLDGSDVETLLVSEGTPRGLAIFRQ